MNELASRVFEAGSWKRDARARVDGGYDAEIWGSREGSEVRNSVQKGAVDGRERCGLICRDGKYRWQVQMS